MTIRCLFLVALLSACLELPSVQTLATDKEGTGEALRTLGHEMSTCSAYFALANAVLKSAHPNDTTVTARYEVAGKVMLAQALAIADVLGLESDLVVAWSSSAMREMVEEINADPKNSAALMTSKYDEPCRMLLKDTTTRLRALMEGDWAD